MTIQINGTSGISGVDGSAGTPALQGSDSNTGISFGADTVNINTGGTTRATVDSSGRVLVGTSSTSAFPILPYAPTNSYSSGLQVAGTATGTSGISVSNWGTSVNNGGTFGFAKSVSNTVGSNGTALIANTRLGSITFSGDDSAKFVLGAAVEALADAAWGVDDGPTRLVFSTTADGASSPTERMRITSSGQILVNRTSPGSAERLSVQAIGANDAIFVDAPSGGSGYVYKSATGSGTAAYFIANNAQAGLISITSSSTSYLSGSDYRLKTDVRSIADPCKKLLGLKPVAFTWVADDSYGESFIAHELQEVYPYAVSGTKDAVDDKGNPAYQCIDQSKLVPLLTAALQEAIAKIESLEARLTAAGI